MSSSFRRCASGFLLLISLLGSSFDSSEGVQLSVPNRCRTEGQVTLTVASGNQLIEHHLPFTETLDSVSKRASVSIGYTGRNPVKYISRDNQRTVFVNSEGDCDSIPQSNILVPELNWFLDELLPRYNYLALVDSDRVSKVLTGPTGLLLISSYLYDNNDVASKITQLNYEKYTLMTEIFLPNGVHYHNVNSTYFTVRITSYQGSYTEEDLQDEKKAILKARFLVDFYNVHNFSEEPGYFNKILDDFNAPLGRACGKFLRKFQPYIPKQSFSMSFYQTSRNDFIHMAYDHSRGFLRKEWPNKAYSVWDLNEDVLYHVVTNFYENILANSQKVLESLQTCSVLRVNDEHLGAAYRPFKLEDQSLDVLQMLGGAFISYLGVGTVREIPCLIYEGIVKEPPFVFSLTEESYLMKKRGNKFEYIVQFYIIRASDDKLDLDEDQLHASLDNFWPSKIKLFRRTIDKSLYELLDELDVYDFYSSIEGGNERAAELFMAAECFNNDEQQTRVEMSLMFDKIHYNHDERKLGQATSLLAFNKFPLESFLIDDMLSLFKVSRMHLVDFQMRLEESHVNLEMELSDRQESKSILYLGSGTLPKENSYLENRIITYSENEESCLLFGSIIVDISMVIYCPHASNLNSNCILVYNEIEPTIRHTEHTAQDSPEHDCQAYQFASSDKPLKAVTNVNELRTALQGHKFQDFEALLPSGLDGSLFGGNRKSNSVKLNGIVKDFEVEHHLKLESIDNYKYVEEGREVRSFEGFNFPNRGDCAKMCNFDPNCRSYSFCSDGTLAGKKNKCAISTLDIGSKRVRETVMDAMKKKLSATVLSEDRSKTYNIYPAEGCDIFGRDYLSLYRDTGEIYLLSKVFVNQFQSAGSTFECAKQSVELELEHSTHQTTMFAFCPANNLCLLDEQLFTTTNSSADIIDHEDEAKPEDADQEKKVSCRIYRRRYQAYFNISSQVFRRHEQQVEFPFESVEECARACWTKLGQVCASFDYCEPDVCLINQVGLQGSPQEELESRQACLHYERDLSWDKLNLEHSLGRHQLYVGSGGSGGGGRSLFGTVVTYALSLAAFFLGLMMGVRINDKMENIRVVRASVSAESGARPSVFSNGISAARQLFGLNQAYQASSFESDYLPAEDIYQDTDDLAMSSSSNAIRMDVINVNEGAEKEE